MPLKNPGDILETNIYVWVRISRIKFDLFPSLSNRIGTGDPRATAQKEAGLNQFSAFCNSNSERNFLIASARKHDAFSRLIPLLILGLRVPSSPEVSHDARTLVAVEPQGFVELGNISQVPQSLATKLRGRHPA